MLTKAEKLYRTDFRSEREFKEAIKSYIHHYNSNRPHSTLRYKTPDEYEAIYFRQHTGFREYNRTPMVRITDIFVSVSYFEMF